MIDQTSYPVSGRKVQLGGRDTRGLARDPSWPHLRTGRRNGALGSDFPQPLGYVTGT